MTNSTINIDIDALTEDFKVHCKVIKLGYEYTSQRSDPAIEFSSGFCDSDFKMKIGGTVYEISTHFDPEGSQCVLQQFRDLILSEDLLENRIIAENAKAR